jgi:hypothetical protein
MIRTKITGAALLIAVALGACGATPAKERQAKARPPEVQIRVSVFPGDIPLGTLLPIPKGMQHLSSEKVASLLDDRSISSPSPNGQDNWDFDSTNDRVLRQQSGGIVPYNAIWPYDIQNDGRVCLHNTKAFFECFYIASKYKEKSYYIVWYVQYSDKRLVSVRYLPIRLGKKRT